MDEKIKYWIDLSNYDLETAGEMLTTGRYLYVGFICHQTIEKIIKAYFTSVKSDARHLLIVSHILLKKLDYMIYFQIIKKHL
jgi:HEPN domain-containing protein